MKIGVLGATGATGLAIVEQAISAGHDVDCFVRNRGKLASHPKAKVTEGSLSDPKALVAWASKQETILVALGHRSIGQQLKARLGLGKYLPGLFISAAVESLIRTAAEGKNLTKIVYCSAYGTHETSGDLPWFFGKLLKPLLIAFSYADHERTENLFDASKVQWVVARPGMLNNGPKTGVYQCVDRFKGKAMNISRADTAHFMLRAATEKTFDRKKIGLGY